jgi:ligand-binding sensor domain-containing protein/signal transduction histidine kinase
MIKKLIILSILNLFFLYAGAWAQVKDLRFKNVGVQEGLSHEKVYCTLQDSKGYMWFGTRNGLSLYDGYNFTVYRNDPENSNSLTSNHIQVLHEDSQGNIWIGTYDGGLNVYDRYTNTFRAFQYNPEDPNSIGSNNIYAIYEDSKQQIWIGTYGGGLCKFNKEREDFEVFKNNPENPNSLINNAVFDILEDEKGNLWLATFGGGLGVYDPSRHTFSAYQHLPEDEFSIPTNELYSLCSDKSGNMWIGTYGKGLIHFNLATQRFTTYLHQEEKSNTISSNYILSMAPDHSGNLWIATQNGGLNYMDVDTKRFYVFKKDQYNKDKLSTDNLNAVYLDKADKLWIATDGEGIFHMNIQSVVFDNFIGDGNAIPGFTAKSVTAIYEDSQNNLWLGTFGEGVYKFNKESQEIINYTQDFFDENSLAGNFITAIVEDEDQILWIGTLNEGLSQYNPQTQQWKAYQHQAGNTESLSNNTINALHIDKQANLWIGTDGGGLCRFNKDSDSFTTYLHDPYHPDRSLAGNVIKVIYEDKNGLWLGTKSSGISRLELNTNKFTNFRHTGGTESALPSNEITGIARDKEGNLWVGTFDKGICKLDTKGKKYVHLTIKEGLVSDNICSILDSQDGSVWISTTRGLSRLNPSSLQIQNFTNEDGLYNQEFVQWSGYKNKKNELFLGQLGSFLRFNPNLVTDTNYQAPVYLTSIKLFDKSVEPDTPFFALSHIDLTHEDNFFELEYALLSYQNPIEREYAYMMENLDQDWKYVGNRRIASYTNLDAGTYVFKVKAKDKNGSWQEITRPVTIVIHPAWYSTWWFRLLAFCIVISSCLIYYYNKLNTIKRHNEELEVLVAKRTHELLEKNEEISVQKKNIEEKNDRLLKVHAIVEERSNELRIINEELEYRVEERTKALKSANEELDTFVYRSYHDIIGPISRLQGLCYVAALEVKDTSALEYITLLRENSDTAKHTLLRVLSIYNIRNHAIKTEITDVLELICNVTSQLKEQLGYVKLELEYEKDFFPLVKTDQELIRIALLNLIENSVKYSRQEEGSYIKISLEKISEYSSAERDVQSPSGLNLMPHTGERSFISIRIRDNGIGIVKDARSKVFTMFFRGDQKKSGMGLGLYLAKLATQKLGGTIHYQHIEPNETLFEIKLPFIQNDLTDPVKSLQENTPSLLN